MLQASFMLYNCDRPRYQSRIDNMNAAYMVAHQSYNQRMTYPLSMHNATKMLNRHKHDNRKNNKKWKNNPDENSGRTRGSGTRGAGTHGRNGNQNGNEENPEEPGTNFAQTNLAQTGARHTCFCCGSLDHLLPDCPYKTSGTMAQARQVPRFQRTRD